MLFSTERKIWTANKENSYLCLSRKIWLGFLIEFFNKYEDVYNLVILWWFEQNLLHQTWLNARYSKVLWRVIWHGRESKLGKAPPSVAFNLLATLYLTTHGPHGFRTHDLGIMSTELYRWATRFMFCFVLFWFLFLFLFLVFCFCFCFCLFVSCFLDKTIHFWSKNNYWKITFFLTIYEKYIWIKVLGSFVRGLCPVLSDFISYYVLQKNFIRKIRV